MFRSASGTFIKTRSVNGFITTIGIDIYELSVLCAFLCVFAPPLKPLLKLWLLKKAKAVREIFHAG